MRGRDSDYEVRENAMLLILTVIMLMYLIARL